MKRLLLRALLKSSIILLPLVPGFSAPPPADAAKSAEQPKKDYVRYVGDDKRGQLQTVIVTMKKGDVTLDLVGAVHVADPEYYKALTQLFTSYEELLFELVDGQKLKQDLESGRSRGGKAKKSETAAADADSSTDAEEERSPAFKIISSLMHGFGGFFGFQYQTDGINYHTKNFVHADVSMDEFVRLQADKNESFVDLIVKAMEAQFEIGSDKNAEPKGSQLLLALLGDSSGLKVAMARQLAMADDLVNAMEQDGGSVIISERNKKALSVLDKEIAAGRKHLALFYGAAHLADMEARLEKLGWTRTEERWLTAWEIKPKADKIRAAAPAKE